MKYLFFLLFLLSFNAFSQEKIDTLNVYYRSLKVHLDYLEANQVRDSTSKPYDVNVELNEQTIKLPSIIGHFKVSYINQQTIRKLSKKESLQLIVVNPLIIDEKSISVNIIDFNVGSNRNGISYSNGGGSRIEFNYDCKSEYYKISNIRQGGL